MLAFLINLEHILSSNRLDTTSILSTIDTVVGIVTSLIAGVCAIKGVTYINKLREKTNTATFTYWTQLCTRLRIFESRLRNNYGLINNLYSTESRNTWSGVGISAKDNDVEEFFDIAKDIQCFMKHTLDQMPAYRGWIDDYYYLAEFIDNIIRCDIKNPDDNFLFKDKKSISDRNEYCTEVCKRIQQIVERTTSKQKQAEEDIYKK